VQISLSYKVKLMNIAEPTILWGQVLLILPAMVFMAAIVVRKLQLPQYELAHTAQRIVMWYSARSGLSRLEFCTF
jgi:hypothetical protein